MLYALFQNYQILSLSIIMLIYLIDLNNKHDGFFSYPQSLLEAVLEKIKMMLHYSM